MSEDRLNVNKAPFPVELESLVSRLSYRNWEVSLEHRVRGQGSRGLTLDIVAITEDSYKLGRVRRTRHSFIVPAACYNEQSWRRWLLNRFLDVESHECCEFFKIDGVRPYAPHHGDGCDPYVIFERGTDEEARTWPGEIKPGVKGGQ